MHNFLLFIKQYNALILFLGLEIIAMLMVVQHNVYQRSTMLNSANVITGGIIKKADDVETFFRLKQMNDSLLAENSHLQAQLTSAQLQLMRNTVDSICSEELPAFRYLLDSTDLYQYRYIGANVISKTITRLDNYLTIDRGRLDGIEPEMGVVGREGVVGVVKDVSDHFAIVIPLIHRSLRISAKLKSNNLVGAVHWNGPSPNEVVLDDIPKHLLIDIGDTVLTSGYSSFFPPNLLIGISDSWSLPDGRNFYEIKVKTATTFDDIEHVYVINYLRKAERRDIEEKAYDK